MKSHNGMRPQDIVILLKILLKQDRSWQYRDLSVELSISISEISESLNRSHLAQLVDESRTKVHRRTLMEFIQYGLPHVFPQQPGSMVTGIPTAHSYPSFKPMFVSEMDYVWPDVNGSMRGLSITPLYKGVPVAVKYDPHLHELLAAIDMLRVGKVREKKVALDLLKSKIVP